MGTRTRVRDMLAGMADDGADRRAITGVDDDPGAIASNRILAFMLPMG